ncbi:MAG: hypothetical protein NDJ90_12660 [Oligoflexia bacterium]|nr:hypothetical protein [Oligoflexia bacterium]
MLLTLTLLFLHFTTTGCSRRATGVAADFQGLRYFGYYADAFAGMTPITPEVLGHINVSWIGGDAADPASIVAALDYTKNHDLKAAISMPPSIFFDGNLTLAEHYQENWNTFAEQIQPYLENILFLYPVEEPFSQGNVAYGVPAAVMKNQLETVASVIKATFPSITLALTYSFVDFAPRNSAFADLPNPLPAGFDWFGFDCYGSWYSCGNQIVFQTVHSIPWYVNQIKSRLSAEQKIFLFADGFVSEANPPSPAHDLLEAGLRLELAERYYQLAASDSAVIGLFGFLFQDDYIEGSERFLGIRHWPELQKKYRQIGMTITGK